ncbi:type III secretion system inner rod subunit SctI [Pandoraea pulmonicola]|uniref:EscI/YscI/HrpB family type III secretion system inner rod protein n=1 Tax=Pandoraea pulmonicola TaxID=93221 RepID=A0AAJ5D018_PANPU|nr:type III secretion system inner rod subunit SctI [Pandoraea pulmonicola]AJC21146.1 EscI/YscI/HrpB family type III secretion system inner rod protein [Pandoraea pulmonicola]SUA90188.1 type III secretion apparatus protein, YscI/HrpB, C-terminal domain [Pandoraea pulmonicola]
MTTPFTPDIATRGVAEVALAMPSLPTTSAGTADAARFEHALASAPSLPEHHLLSAAGKLAGHSERLVQRVTADERLVNDPVRMLSAQRELTERVLALEFVAKVAGAGTQGINKLVHMQ